MTYKTPLIVAVIAGAVLGRNLFGHGQVLSWVIEGTPTPIPTMTPTPTPTPMPTPTVTPRPTRVPTPTPVPQPQFTSQQIYEFTNQYAGQYGISPDILRYIAVCESGFNPSARYHIYAGLYQFDAATWKRFRALMGEDPHPDLRYNAQAAVKTAAYLLSQNRAYLWPNCVP